VYVGVHVNMVIFNKVERAKLLLLCILKCI
jgi:hypothetical protein